MKFLIHKLSIMNENIKKINLSVDGIKIFFFY